MIRLKHFPKAERRDPHDRRRAAGKSKWLTRSQGRLWEFTGLEGLESRIMLAVTPLKFDFGTPESPVAEGYEQVTSATVYAPSQGSDFGWTEGTVDRVMDRDREAPNDDLRRDFNFAGFAGDATFRVDVPDGTYLVTVTMGDQIVTHDAMQLTIEDLVVGPFTTEAGSFITESFPVTIADGTLDVTTRDLGGVDENVNLNSLELQAMVGEIHGTKWKDLNGDGQRDPDEPGVEGWTVYLDSNGNDQLDEGEPFELTDVNGDYWFLDLPADTYTVAEVLQPGWEQTYPAGSECFELEDLPLGMTYNVGDMFTTTSTDGSVTTVNVLEFITTGGTTTGRFSRVDNGGRAGGSGQDLELNNVNLDFDLGGPVDGLTLNFGEYGGNLNLEINGDFQNFEDFADINGTIIGGTVITVTNGLGNDKGMLNVDGTVTSFVIGGQELWIDDICIDPVPARPECFELEDLPLGMTYNVGDTFSTTSTDGSVTTVNVLEFITTGGTTTGRFSRVDDGGRAGGSGQDLELNNVNLDFDLGGPVDGLTLNFGEYGGNLNLEINGDFQNFEDFADINGTIIGGTVITVTNGLGNDKGILTVNGRVTSFVIGGQELWIDNVCIDPVSTGGSGVHVVELGPGEVVRGIDFGNHPVFGQIHGTKWNDLDGDGQRDPDEPGLEGWTIYLDLNSNAQRDRSEPFELTDAAGDYWFRDLPPGNYIVAEEVQPGWQQTFPAVSGGEFIPPLVNSFPGPTNSGQGLTNDGERLFYYGDNSTIYTLDPHDGQVLNSFPVAQDHAGLGLAHNGTSLFAIDSSYAGAMGSVREIDPVSGALLNTFSLDGSVLAATFIGEKLYVFGQDATNHLRVLDPSTGNTIDSFPIALGSLDGLTAAGPHLVGVSGETYYQIDPQSGDILDSQTQPFSISPNQRVRGLTSDGGRIFATGYNSNASASAIDVYAPVIGGTHHVVLVAGDVVGDIDFGNLPAPTMVYENSFEANGEWFASGVTGDLSGDGSPTPVQGYATFPDSRFDGNFLRNTTDPPLQTSLTLNNLPPHTSVDLDFLLALIDSWDGDGPTFAPDFFNVTVDDVSVFSETFISAAQGPQGHPDQSYAPRPHVFLEFGQLGFNENHPDVAYDFGNEHTMRNIAHTADSLTVEFFASGSGWQGGDDESWAIENLQVWLDRRVGDLNGDGVVDAEDIDMLCAAINSSSTNLYFDVNDSGTVDQDDVVFLVENVIGTFMGDANLDGKVDAMDLNEVGINWRITAGMGWKDGDFDCDGAVNASDLNILGLNWQKGVVKPVANLVNGDRAMPAQQPAPVDVAATHVNAGAFADRTPRAPLSPRVPVVDAIFAYSAAESLNAEPANGSFSHVEPALPNDITLHDLPTRFEAAERMMTLSRRWITVKSDAVSTRDHGASRDQADSLFTPLADLLFAGWRDW